MTTVLLVAGYIAIAALCVYLEARLTGDGALGPMWLVWPLILPVAALAFGTEWLIDMGERHRG